MEIRNLMDLMKMVLMIFKEGFLVSVLGGMRNEGVVLGSITCYE